MKNEEKDKDSRRKSRASTTEGRYDELADLALEEIERRVRNHKATGPELIYLAKQGSTESKMRRDNMQADTDLKRSKIKSIEQEGEIAELYKNAIAAFTQYKQDE